jgi:integrase/recombinase XerD
MMNYEWKSDFSSLIQSFLQVKRMIGFKFQTQERHLQHLDHFYYYNGYQGTTFTKSMLEEFIYNKDERPCTHRNKEIIMNQFTTWLMGRGISAYVPEIRTEVPHSKYIPHIYTTEELRRFFHAVDTYPATPNSFRNTVDPVLFRFLYGTGVRLSEALNLCIADIFLEEAYVMIKQSKNGKHRIVPMAPSLARRVKDYISTFHISSNLDLHIFPGKGMNKMDKSTAYNHFRDYLLLADIPHTGKGPRIHDFRHGLAVANLRRWASTGADLTNMLPYLSAYMGHSDFRATQYYLRLTAEVYPELVAMTEATCRDVIPEGEFTYEEI